jgi:hypothetical protein
MDYVNIDGYNISIICNRGSGEFVNYLNGALSCYSDYFNSTLDSGLKPLNVVSYLKEFIKKISITLTFEDYLKIKGKLFFEEELLPTLNNLAHVTREVK